MSDLTTDAVSFSALSHPELHKGKTRLTMHKRDGFHVVHPYFTIFNFAQAIIPEPMGCIRAGVSSFRREHIAARMAFSILDRQARVEVRSELSRPANGRISVDQSEVVLMP
jgi:hypothetical protein